MGATSPRRVVLEMQRLRRSIELLQNRSNGIRAPQKVAWTNLVLQSAARIARERRPVAQRVRLLAHRGAVAFWHKEWAKTRNPTGSSSLGRPRGLAGGACLVPPGLELRWASAEGSAGPVPARRGGRAGGHCRWYWKLLLLPEAGRRRASDRPARVDAEAGLACVPLSMEIDAKCRSAQILVSAPLRPRPILAAGSPRLNSLVLGESDMFPAMGQAHTGTRPGFGGT